MHSVVLVLLFIVILTSGVAAIGIGEQVYAPGPERLSTPVLENADYTCPPAPRELLAPRPVWMSLKGMTAEERANARLTVLLPPGAPHEARMAALKISDTWNAGGHADALAALEHLDDIPGADGFEIITEYIDRPVFAGNGRGTDVRIGDMDSCYIVQLVYDPATDNMMAFAVFPDSGYTRWRGFLSVDGGATWQQTIQGTNDHVINDFSADVSNDGHAYIARVAHPDQYIVRVQRFDMTDGGWSEFPTGGLTREPFWLFQGPELRDIHLMSDLYAEGDGRLYLTLIMDDNELIVLRSHNEFDTEDQLVTAITDADRGLSGAMNSWGATGYEILVSYIATDDTLTVLGFNGIDAYSRILKRPVGASYADNVSITSHQDTIHCFYEFAGDVTDLYVRYEVSYNGGLSWFWGTVDDTLSLSECPVVTSRDSGGVAVAYRYYSSPRSIRATWRNYTGYPWPTPVDVADHEPYYEPGDIASLGNLEYGIVYMSWTDPEDQAVFFDKVSFASLCCEGDRGNVDGDAGDNVNIVDMTFLVAYLFSGGPPPPCPDEADINGDSAINIVDMTALVAYLFSGGPPPVGC